MPIWPAHPVTEQPTLTLRSWSVLQLSDGALHLVGYCIENREGRATSAVQSLDAQRLRATTRSGRVYALSGRPGGNLDAEYVWLRWAAINAVDAWEDITEAVWQQAQAGASVGVNNTQDAAS